jgi:hypothetical protein
VGPGEVIESSFQQQCESLDHTLNGHGVVLYTAFL